MFTPPRAARLCGRCRQDVLTIFIDGFCAPTTKGRHQRKVLPNLRVNQPTVRFLSSTLHARERFPQEPASDRTKTHDSSPQTIPDAQSVEEQFAALQELEKRLGKKIEEAIEEDQLAAVQNENQEDDSLSPILSHSQFTDHVATDSVATVRDNGAGVDEIVREARQVYGDTLPEGVLNQGEFDVYKRLYDYPDPEVEEVEDVDDEHELLDVHGQPVSYDATQLHQLANLSEDDEVEMPQVEDVGNSLRFHDDMSSALPSPEDLDRAYQESVSYRQSEDNKLEVESDSYERAHPLTTLGKFETYPSTVFLPKEAYLQPVNQIMSAFSNKHLQETCEKTFGGPGLPDSPLTPRTGKSRQQVPLPLDVKQHAMSQMEANAYLTVVMPPTYAAITSVLVETRKRLGRSWLTNLLSKEGGPRVLDVGGAGAGIIAWREVVRAHWDSLHTSKKQPPPLPPSKSVVLTGSDTLRQRAAQLLDNTTFVPRLPDYVHTRDQSTLDDDRPAQAKKQFDVVIASHSVFPLREDWMRKQHIQNLWSLVNPDGGVLIIIEKGIPRGFEALAEAREILLERFIKSPDSENTVYGTREDPDSVFQKEPGMIIAPCPNHDRCPMYLIPGKSRGRTSWCSFTQRYQRPAHLQRVLGANIKRNHDDVDFSYISVMKGRDLRGLQPQSLAEAQDPTKSQKKKHDSISSSPLSPAEWTDECHTGFESVVDADQQDQGTFPSMHSLPRNVFQPLKRRGHVIMDVCTPDARIERWTVARSFSKQAFRDARKAQLGDLWALGAKTRLPSNLRLGTVEGKEAKIIRKHENKIRDAQEQNREDELERRLNQSLEEAEFGDVVSERKKSEKKVTSAQAQVMIDEDDNEDDVEALQNRGVVEEEEDDDDDDDEEPIDAELNDLLNEPENDRQYRSKTKTPSSSSSSSAQYPKDINAPPKSRFANDPTLTESQRNLLDEWASEFEDNDRSRGRGKRGGVFSKQGNTVTGSKEAKREQKALEERRIRKENRARREERKVERIREARFEKRNGNEEERGDTKEGEKKDEKEDKDERES